MNITHAKSRNRMKRPLKTIPFTEQPLFIFYTLAPLDVSSIELCSVKKKYIYIKIFNIYIP